MVRSLDDVIAGYRRFHQRYFVRHRALIEKLAHGQAPKVAIIACSDSRVDPSIITNSRLGELFVIRNVANLVPPHQPDHGTYHGTSAALEFAVRQLQVEHVIVFGHSRCAGIRALLETADGVETNFVTAWVGMAKAVRDRVLMKHRHEGMDVCAHVCERESIAHSLGNLRTFPWIAERIAAEQLMVHGWHFDIASGEMWGLDEARAEWSRLV